MNAKTLSFAFLILAATAAAAADDGRPRPAARAARTPSPPTVDGRVEEAVWGLAPAIEGFTQQRPDNGEPVSEPTRVHVLFDDDALYVAAVLDHRTHPVTRLLGRRDTFLASDWFGILLDPQHDRRSGYAFFVNPDGVQYDEVIANDVEEDTTWDAVWQSAARLGETGWSVEMRIPLAELRFAERVPQVWGLNFIRWIRGRQEQARWVSHPLDQPGFASRFGDLAGLDGVRPRSRLELRPYVSAAALRDAAVPAGDPLGRDGGGAEEVGLDLRWTSRSNLTLTGTLNPDFGQVEVDPAVLDLSGFELFLPEKRPFFLDGAKLFNFGGVATAYTTPFAVGHPRLFYSRRIGREPQGTARLAAEAVDAPGATRILGALKLLGRTAGGTSVALLDALTAEERAELASGGALRSQVVEPGASYFAGRVTRDLGERRRIGLLATSTDRRSRAATAFLPETARVLGLDGYAWLGDRDLLIDWMVAGSRVDGPPQAIALLQRSPAHAYQRPDADHLRFDPARDELSGWGGKLTLSRETGAWRYQLQGQAYSPGFDVNELGFHARSDLRAAHAVAAYHDVTPGRVARSWRLWGGRWWSENGGGEPLAGGWSFEGTTTLRNYWTGSAGLFRTESGFDDRETRGGPRIARPPGWSSSLRVGSDTRKPVWVELARGDGDDEDGGSSRSTALTLGWRPRSNISLQLAATAATRTVAAKFVGAVDDPLAAATYGRRWVFGELVERRLELAPRLDWTFHRNLSLQLYLQPFAASGTYAGLAELAAPGGGYRAYTAVERGGGVYRVDPDGAAAAPPFVLADPDFSLRSLRGNAVLRWEVGAATLYAVWSEGREERLLATSSGRWEDLWAIDDLPAEDRFLLKASYRLDLPR